jgi:hypothetical protein
MTPAQIQARNEAIRRAWDDPLRCAMARKRAHNRKIKRKLTDGDYAEIRLLHWRHQWTQTLLARSFRVSRTMIQKILDL